MALGGTHMDEQVTTDSDRRRFLKRAGVVAGATVWATPVVQSLTSPSYATGSPAPCTTPKLVRFKFNVGGSFDSGQPPPHSTAGACTAQVAGYNESLPGRYIASNGSFVDGTCKVTVKVTLSNGNKTATITVTNGIILDADIKGGSSKSSKNGYCSPGWGPPNGGSSSLVLNAPSGGAAISFVAGVVCPTC